MELWRNSLAYYVMFAIVVAALARGDSIELNRSNFPKGFVFGAGSSAYQIEGAANEGGKGPSIWDTFTHIRPDLIVDKSNGDIAVDSYHRYEEDVKCLTDIGLDAYRLSISWSRILPNGSVSGGINQEGIDYYNRVFDKLVSKGVQPFVTLFHWDLPQSLEDSYGGFLSSKIIKDFKDYAEICFKEFGDRVKNWITVNEPGTHGIQGHAHGVHAPNRCSPNIGRTRCTGGDSKREPYIVAHNQLLAHAAAVNLYRNKFKETQKGSIGIIVVSDWMYPYNDTKADRDAVERALDFMYGWFMDPPTKGDYPSSMRTLVGSRLPKFTEDQSRMVKGSYDFIGLNYYSTNYVYDVPFTNKTDQPDGYYVDGYFVETWVRNGIPIGPQATGSFWLYIYPKGLRELLLYTKAKYNNPIIYITENGVSEKNNQSLSLDEALQDDQRINFHRDHFYYIHSAIKEGVDVRGYFAWTLMDDYEWDFGYTVRFGIYYVDYNDDLKRYPKKSAFWFKKFLGSRNFSYLSSI